MSKKSCMTCRFSTQNKKNSYQCRERPPLPAWDWNNDIIVFVYPEDLTADDWCGRYSYDGKQVELPITPNEAPTKKATKTKGKTWLQAYREKHGMTQAQMAKQLIKEGVFNEDKTIQTYTGSTVCELESGKTDEKTISPRLRESIERRFKRPLSEILKEVHDD